MIRINLAGDAGAGLESPPARSGRVSRGRTLQRVLALGVILGAAAVILNWRMEQAARSRRLEARIQQVRRQRQQHQELARELQRLEQRGRSMERRIGAIERLRALQARPVRVLDLLSDCVQAIPGLRLQELSRKNGILSLRGLVGESSRVSAFIARLQSTGEFHRVELIRFQEQDGQYAFALALEGAVPEEAGKGVEEAATGPPPHRPSPSGSAVCRRRRLPPTAEAFAIRLDFCDSPSRGE